MVSSMHVVPKKSSFTMVENDKHELVQTRLPTKVRVCIDYRKLNAATRKDHFPLSFIDQMLERLAGLEYYCFFDGYSGYNQIPIAQEDQKKDNIHVPLCDICLSPNAFRPMQSPRHIPTLYVKPFFWYGRVLLRDFHGRLLRLWKFIWPMSPSLGASTE